jgi:hypothetical protein
MQHGIKAGVGLEKNWTFSSKTSKSGGISAQRIGCLIPNEILIA